MRIKRFGGNGTRNKRLKNALFSIPSLPFNFKRFRSADANKTIIFGDLFSLLPFLDTGNNTREEGER